MNYLPISDEDFLLTYLIDTLERLLEKTEEIKNKSSELKLKLDSNIEGEIDFNEFILKEV